MKALSIQDLFEYDVLGTALHDLAIDGQHDQAEEIEKAMVTGWTQVMDYILLMPEKMDKAIETHNASMSKMASELAEMIGAETCEECGKWHVIHGGGLFSLYCEACRLKEVSK